MTVKRKYEKPSMEVHVLKQRARLLVGSAKSGTMSDPEDYELTDDPFAF